MMAFVQICYDGADVSVPFNMEVLNWANETRKLLSSAEVPNQIKFYNIYGTNHETPHCVWYKTLKILYVIPHVSNILECEI